MSELYFDRQGQPIDMFRFEELLAEPGYKQVAEDFIGAQGEESVRISTIWLGLNFQWLPDQPPRIFETMIFGSDTFDGMQWRYATEEQALAGHADAVALVRVRYEQSKTD